MSALEAISMGKPCIATDIGGLKEVLDETCAFLIKPDSNYCQAFSDAVRLLYERKELYYEYSQNALKRSSLFYDKQGYHERFSELVSMVYK